MHLDRPGTSLQGNVRAHRRRRRRRTVLHNFPADHALARHVISSPSPMLSDLLNLLPPHQITPYQRAQHKRRPHGNLPRTSHPFIFFHSSPPNKNTLGVLQVRTVNPDLEATKDKSPPIRWASPGNGCEHSKDQVTFLQTNAAGQAIASHRPKTTPDKHPALAQKTPAKK